jgi:hypothetical protein
MELRATLHALSHQHVNAAFIGTLFAKRIRLNSIAEMSGHEPCTRRIDERRMIEA